MTDGPTFDDVFAVMSAASVGDATARVVVPPEPQYDDPATRLAVALNLLLDDLQLRSSELERTEEQLRQAQRLEAIGRLVGGVAHDFNNVLTAISGYGQLLRDSLPDGEDRSMAIQIVAGAERAAALVRQLLAFGRRQVLEPRIVDPSELIAGLVPLVKLTVGEHIEFTVIEAPNRPRVRVDPTQLEQVLMNLVANARDAMTGGGQLTVEFASVELDDAYASGHPEVVPGPYVMIAVSDTGRGMSPEVREHVFEPFFTTRTEEGGTGLGLATVYGIVKQSGGSIAVYSEAGSGTVFKVYLPRAFEAFEQRPPATVDDGRSVGTETILIAEDDAAVRAIAETVLSRAGYNVIAADGGPMALELAGAHDGVIHLLITDVVMGKMSGLQLSKQLTRLRPEIRTLFVSGYAENTIAHHGVLDPDLAFLQKPFTPSGLARKVREVLEEQDR